MPAGTFSNLQIQAYHDEDMQVYINGILAASVTGYATSYQFFDIAPAALAQLTPGATLEFAVHCHQTVGGQNVDVGLVNIGSSSPTRAPVRLVSAAPINEEIIAPTATRSATNIDLLTKSIEDSADEAML